MLDSNLKCISDGISCLRGEVIPAPPASRVPLVVVVWDGTAISVGISTVGCAVNCSGVDVIVVLFPNNVAQKFDNTVLIAC